MIKCVVFDIGNTLISKEGDNKVASILKSDIKRLRNQGLIVGVASMRTHRLSLKILEGLDFDFFICLSGAQIYIDGKKICDKPLDYSSIKETAAVYYDETDTYALDEYSASVARNQGFVVESVKSMHNTPIYNVALLNIDEREIIQYQEDFHTEYWSEIKVLVLQNKETSKGKAVNQIAKYYGIHPNEIVGFGDGPNDVGFLSMCGTAIAVGNGYKPLCDISTWSTDTEGNLGVSKALRQLGLINDKVLFFIESIDQVGGMEIHGKYFIEYFKRFTDLYVITHKMKKNVLVFKDNQWIEKEISDLSILLKQTDSINTMIFFNSGHWIEEMQWMKNQVKASLFFYRTGGNEIISSPLDNPYLDIEHRKSFWKSTLNTCISYLITNSSFTEMRLLDFGINKEIFRRVVGGVDTNQIKENQKNWVDIRNNIFVEKTAINFVSVSRFEPYKRIELLTETFQRLDQSKFHLYLIGDGPLFSSIRARYQMVPNVTFLGKKSHHEALQYISVADYYIQFSGDTITNLNGLEYVHAEGMGRTFLEAITAQTFVIGTKSGALDEIIREDNGILIESDNPKVLAEIVAKLDTSKIRRNISDKYDFDNVFNQYFRIWRENG